MNEPPCCRTSVDQHESLLLRISGQQYHARAETRRTSKSLCVTPKKLPASKRRRLGFKIVGFGRIGDVSVKAQRSTSAAVTETSNLVQNRPIEDASRNIPLMGWCPEIEPVGPIHLLFQRKPDGTGLMSYSETRNFGFGSLRR